MIELEQRADQAWGLMCDFDMPAKIVLGYVEEVLADGDVGKVLEALILAAKCAWQATRPPVLDGKPAGAIADFDLGAICGTLLRGDWRFAEPSAEGLRRRLRYEDLDPASAIADVTAWVHWCATVERGIDLCRQLVDAGAAYRKWCGDA